jgi:quercetin dioxygenase-like cupin family protein
MKVVRATEHTHGRPTTARFDGDVWQAEPIIPSAPDGLRGDIFVYSPGVRSHWHIHTGEQALIVLYGRGLIQWEGGEVVAVQAGDWVHVTPGVPHWHGAAEDASFAHAAVTASGSPTWLDPVRDAADDGGGNDASR